MLESFPPILLPLRLRGAELLQTDHGGLPFSVHGMFVFYTCWSINIGFVMDVQVLDGLKAPRGWSERFPSILVPNGLRGAELRYKNPKVNDKKAMTKCM